MPKGRYPARMARLGLRVVPDDSSKERQSEGAPKLHRDEIVLNRRRIVYHTGGSGPLLVLIHGITLNSATWDRVLPKLARRHTVLAPDLPATAARTSSAATTRGRTRQHRARSARRARPRTRDFVGHSLGGGVALQLAYQYPERVDRLVLVAPGGFGREVTVLLRAAGVPGPGPVLALAASRQVVEAGTLLAGALGRLGVHGTTTSRSSAAPERCWPTARPVGRSSTRCARS
jgi:pimeloyl-ACP methyl ester carboxylesterase